MHKRIKKHGITVDCEGCQFTSSDWQGVFDIIVPVSDSETGVSGPARLRCAVSTGRHEVELLEWRDFNRKTIELGNEHMSRLLDTLDYIADHKVCGNSTICPSKVVQAVEKKKAS